MKHLFSILALVLVFSASSYAGGSGKKTADSVADLLDRLSQVSSTEANFSDVQTLMKDPSVSAVQEAMQKFSPTTNYRRMTLLEIGHMHVIANAILAVPMVALQDIWLWRRFSPDSTLEMCASAGILILLASPQYFVNLVGGSLTTGAIHLAIAGFRSKLASIFQGFKNMTSKKAFFARLAERGHVVDEDFQKAWIIGFKTNPFFGLIRSRSQLLDAIEEIRSSASIWRTQFEVMDLESMTSEEIIQALAKSRPAVFAKGRVPPKCAGLLLL